MKYAVFAVLLAVMHAAPPVPGQASNDATQTPANVKAKSNPNQAQPAPAPDTGKPDSDGPTESDNGKQHSKDTDHSVVIRELPTVTVNSPRRDWVDWGGWLFNLLLVTVGAFQVLLLCWTLRVIRVQAREMQRQRGWMRRQWVEMSQQTKALKEYVEETKKIAKSTVDSAKAAQDNIALVVNKERARIRIVKPEKLSLVVGNIIGVEFKLLFYGTTPAFEVQSKVNCILSESKESFTPFIPHGIHDLPSVVSSSDIKPSYRDFLMNLMPLDDETLIKISKLETFLHFAGTIKYNDFMEVSRETAFHYRWNAPDISPNNFRRLAFPEGWEEVGGEKENYYT
jgi:hypothetical protein